MAVTLAASEARRVGNLMFAVVDVRVCIKVWMGEVSASPDCGRVQNLYVKYVEEKLRAQSMKMSERDSTIMGDGGGPHLSLCSSCKAEECLPTNYKSGGRRKGQVAPFRYNYNNITKYQGANSRKKMH